MIHASFFDALSSMRHARCVMLGVPCLNPGSSRLPRVVSVLLMLGDFLCFYFSRLVGVIDIVVAWRCTALLVGGFDI